MPERTVVACLGDSITEGSPYWDSRSQTGEPEGQWEHWAALAHPELELRNFGIWGERTDEIAARFETAVAGAEVLVLQGGINDIAQRLPVEPAAARLGELVRQARERGLRIALCDVLPWNNADAEQARAIVELNELIAHHAAELAVPVLPFHDTLTDPKRPGRMKDAWCNADGDHPSIDGYRRLGELAFRLP